MPATKSSASSATRKKHARKQAARKGDDDVPDPGQPKKLQRGEKKTKKDKRAALKKKEYIPPPKPPRGAQDPVDLYGLGIAGASPLPAEIVVTLRLLMKRAENTVTRAIEDLDAWIRTALKHEHSLQQVLLTIPVWAHHFPRFVTHGSRRVRLLAATLHNLLAVGASQTRSELLTPALLANPDYVGAWCASAFDVDRSVRTTSRRTWDSVVDLSSSADSDDRSGLLLSAQLEGVLAYLREIVLPSKSGATVQGPDETDEDTIGRNSRLTTGAIEALNYLIGSFSSADLSTSYAHIRTDVCQATDASHFDSVLGAEELWAKLDSRSGDLPMVRRAMWPLLKKVLSASSMQKTFNEMLPNISHCALHGAFAEADTGVQNVMWPSLIPLLQQHREAWSLADEDGQDSDSSEDEEADLTHGTETSRSGEADAADDIQPDMPPIMVELLGFLQLACRSNPKGSYPIIVVLLASMPAPILPARKADIDAFFSSFWAAFDGRAIEPYDATGEATVTFFESVLECTVLLDGRTREDAADGPATSFIAENCERTWREMLGQGSISGQKLAHVQSSVIGAIAKTMTRSSHATREVLRALRRYTFEIIDSNVEAVELGKASVQLSASSGEDQLGMDFAIAVFERIVDGFSRHAPSACRLRDVQAMLSDVPIQQALLAHSSMKRLDIAVSQVFIVDQPSPDLVVFIAFYMQIRAEQAVQTDIWMSMVSQIRRSSQPFANEYLVALLSMHAGRALPKILPSAGFDEIVLTHLSEILVTDSRPSAKDLKTVVEVLLAEEPFIAPATVDRVLDLCMSAARESGRDVAFQMLATMTAHRPLLQRLITRPGGLLALIFVFETLHFDDDPAIKKDAGHIWRHILASEESERIRMHVLEHLRHLLFSMGSTIGSDQLFTAVDELELPRDAVFNIIFPVRDTLDGLWEATGLASTVAELSILDPMLGTGTSYPRGSPHASAYARAVLAGVRMLLQDRSKACEAAWILPHALRVSRFAKDEIAVEQSASLILGPVSLQEAESISAVCDALCVSVISMLCSEMDVNAHRAIVARIQGVKQDGENAGLVYELLETTLPTYESASDNARVFRDLLATIFRGSDAGPEEAEIWLGMATSWQKTNPSYSLAVLLCARELLFSTNALQRLQNEFASGLAGITPSRANADGVRLLRLLMALAPSSDSSFEFLSQQRTIFLLQALQRWFASEESLGDEVHALVAELFAAVAPIVQDRDGSHWDLMLDVQDSNVETSSLAETASFAGLFHSMRLFSTLQDLASRNSDLRSRIQPRLKQTTSIIAKAVLVPCTTAGRSQPADTILRLGLDILQNSASFATSSLAPGPALFPLLRHTDSYIRQNAFAMAQRDIEEQVQTLVVEAEIETDLPVSPQLPVELLGLLRPASTSSAEHMAFLLGWLLVIEYFTHSSFRLKSAYLDQLRRNNLVEQSLLPRLFAALGVSDHGFPFDPSPWSFEALESALVDNGGLSSILLASHVYMRALQTIPSLVRSWWESQRNRQLSNSVSAFTSKHFSPILIAREMALIDAGKLADDDMAIKMSATGAEVRAIYTVDDTPMELTMRLPSDYPLSSVVVSDRREIGVAEKQWRAWVLAVQQVVTTQNGLLSDALALFKRNVSLHFEGVEACAICYSVISVLDRTLPTKRCRTCKNLFHAGCLFKWFSTSSGSTCPLCRAIF